MNTIPTIIEMLSRTPTVLQHLLDQIPPDRYDVRRVEEQWSVKEWLCHLVDAQDVLMDRFIRFETEDNPMIGNYEPPPQSDIRYRDRDFSEAVDRFSELRAHTIRNLSSFDETYWNRLGRHESFSPYGTKMLIGHMLNVDYAHLFSMEQIGLGIEIDGE